MAVAARILAAAAPERRGKSPARAALSRLLASPVARVGLAIVSTVVLIALITPAVHYYDAKTDSTLTLRLKPPSWQHPFGTDTLGRDILIRVLHGARVSLGLGVSSVALAALVGIALGLVAGYVGGGSTSSSCSAWTSFSPSPRPCSPSPSWR